MADKVEAVHKVSEALHKQQPLSSAEDIERVSPNKEHFQSLLNSTQQPLQTAFQRTNGLPNEGIHHLENPVFTNENVSSQKSGTATDEERKRRSDQSEGEEEVESIAATSSKRRMNSSSLMDEVKRLNTQASTIGHLSPEDLKVQTSKTIAQIDQVKAQLSQVQGNLKPSYQTLLRNRLTHIDDNVKIALSKAGVEYTHPTQLADTKTKNPIERFIGFLTHSQYQLENLNTTIDQLNITGAQLNPAAMLAIQIKVGYVQQQIELFTSLLNKALESTKTIMNVQV